MMGVVEKMVVESKTSPSPPCISSSSGQWRPGTGGVDGHRKIWTSVHIVGCVPEEKRWNWCNIERRKWWETWQSHKK